MASDDFTDTNGTTLESHDSNWAKVSIGNGTGSEIQSNLCRAIGAWDNSYYRYTTGDPDHSEFVAKANTVERRVANCRMPSNERGYAMRFSQASAVWNAITFFKDGTWTAADTISYSGTVDRTFKTTASGTSTVTIKAFVDGTEEFSYDDTSSTLSGGLPGFEHSPNGAVGNVDIDDWTDGVTAGGATGKSNPLNGPLGGPLAGVL